MDWAVFWSAFGAIGTTIGSLITAIAVIIAVRQYKQPITKRIKIMFNLEFPIMSDGNSPEIWAGIGVTNIGTRPIQIKNIMLNLGDKNLLISSIQIQYPEILPIQFPSELQLEENVEMHLQFNRLAYELSKLIQKDEIMANRKIKILVSDTANQKYLYKTKWSAKRIINFAQKNS